MHVTYVALQHVTHKRDVTAVLCVPERDVLRIEAPLGDHGLVTHQGPVKSVRRLERVHAVIGVLARDLMGAASTAHEGLVPRVGHHIWTGVDERNHVTPPTETSLESQLAPPFFRRQVLLAIPAKHDVVVCRPLVSEQTKVGLGPVDTIGAFGIAHRFAASVLASTVMMSAVVHAKKVTVLEHGDVAQRGIFPGLVVHQYDLFAQGFVHVTCRIALEAVHKPVINKQFAPRANMGRLVGRI